MLDFDAQHYQGEKLLGSSGMKVRVAERFCSDWSSKPSELKTAYTSGVIQFLPRLRESRIP